MIIIAIASIGRADLLKTLASLDAQDLGAAYKLHVVIGDDSRDGAVPRLLADYSPQRLTLEVLDVNRQNISDCRNATLKAALSHQACTHVGFIDDDEVAEPNWLATLLKTVDDNQADAAFGLVLSRFDEDVPDWLQTLDPLTRSRREKDGETAVGRTGNALLRADKLRAADLLFDPDLGRTGGEDTAFFAAFKARGNRLWFNAQAQAYEFVPASRMEPSFLLKRAMRSGQVYGSLIVSNKETALGRGLFYADALIKMLVGYGAAIMLRPFSRGQAFLYKLRGAANLGKVRLALGLELPELY
ncbi:MAG: glycosyltransferase [Hyphomicrobiales bacterium]